METAGFADSAFAHQDCFALHIDDSPLNPGTPPIDKPGLINMGSTIVHSQCLTAVLRIYLASTRFIADLLAMLVQIAAKSCCSFHLLIE